MPHRYRLRRALAGPIWLRLACVGLLLPLASRAHAAEHITLSNGFELDCSRRESVGDKVRLYLRASSSVISSDDPESNYIEVAAGSVVRVEAIPEQQRPLSAPLASRVPVSSKSLQSIPAKSLQPTPARSLQPSVAELHEILARAGAGHNIDTDLLASVVDAESGGHLRAVSRAGARGLMQLMPGTALALGVNDPFIAEQNVEGGTRYFDQLLSRYHDNIALTLAAYNAGPGAVDRYHGVPPFRETQLYVARVIREFNRRKLMLIAQR